MKFSEYIDIDNHEKQVSTDLFFLGEWFIDLNRHKIAGSGRIFNPITQGGMGGIYDPKAIFS